MAVRAGCCCSTYFYPRPLRGGRHGKVGATTISSLFLSTPSARRATSLLSAGPLRVVISIHALCEEGDLFSRLPVRPDLHFYPRPLRGGRPGVLIL